LFETDEVTEAMAAAGIAPDPASLRPEFDRTVGAIFAEARLDVPVAPWAQSGGRQGRHGEGMGFLLAELQHMQRTYPGATW
jgi:ring-1,2-phenylacetyl-CoA epoxidase subunit PaaC